MIRWTQNEYEDVALKAQMLFSTTSMTYAECLRQAQSSVLPPERQRSHSALTAGTTIIKIRDLGEKLYKDMRLKEAAKAASTTKKTTRKPREKKAEQPVVAQQPEQQTAQDPVTFVTAPDIVDLVKELPANQPAATPVPIINLNVAFPEHEFFHRLNAQLEKFKHQADQAHYQIDEQMRELHIKQEKIERIARSTVQLNTNLLQKLGEMEDTLNKANVAMEVLDIVRDQIRKGAEEIHELANLLTEPTSSQVVQATAKPAAKVKDHIRPNLPRVLILGLKGDQQHMLARQFSDRLQLVFADPQGGAFVEASKSADYIISSKWARHSTTGQYKNEPNYTHLAGGMTAIRNRLNEIVEKQ